MTHRRGAVWTERLLLGLILFSLAGTLNLLVAIHRRASADRQAPPSGATGRLAEHGGRARGNAAGPDRGPRCRRESRAGTTAHAARRPHPEGARFPCRSHGEGSRVGHGIRSACRCASRRGTGRPSRSRVVGSGARCWFDSRSPGSRLTRKNSSARPTRSTPNATCSNASATPPRPRSRRRACGLALPCCHTRGPMARGGGRL